MPDRTTGTNPDPISIYDENGVEIGTILSKRFGKALGGPQVVSAIGPTILYDPASGQAVRLKWIALATSQNNTAEVIATVRLGSTDIYKWPLGNPGAFMHSSIREGAVDENLTIELSVSGQPVYVNIDVEEFVP